MLTSEDFCLSWLQNKRNSSTPDERIFILTVRKSGLYEAVLLAAGFNWQCKRPLRAILKAYHASMKSSPKPTDEYTTFQNALRQVLQVSKTELNRREAAYKAANAGKPKRGPKPKTSASDRASS